MELNWNFLGGQVVQNKKPSMGGVWIFSGKFSTLKIVIFYCIDLIGSILTLTLLLLLACFSPTKKGLRRVRVLYAFQARNSKELTVHQGEEVAVRRSFELQFDWSSLYEVHCSQ